MINNIIINKMAKAISKRSKVKALTQEEFDNYFNSEQYKIVEELGDRKVRRLVIDDFNRAKENVVSEGVSGECLNAIPELTQVYMTRESFDKANLASKLISELNEEPIELYFYLINSLSAYRNNDHIIRDVYITKEQKVTPSNCIMEVDGISASCYDIINNFGSRVVAWGHSHADLGTYHSSRDNFNIRNLLINFGIDKHINIGSQENTSYEFNICYIPSIVFNMFGSKPFVGIALSYMKWVYDIETDTINKERVYKFNQNVSLKLINERNGIEIDEEDIKRQLLERVIVKGRGRLSGKYKEREGLATKKASSPIGRGLPYETPSDYDLQQRIKTLEINYDNLEKRVRILEVLNQGVLKIKKI